MQPNKINKLLNIDEFETNLMSTATFYVNKFGIDLHLVHDKIQEMSYFKRADPEEVVNSIFFLRLQDCNPKLFWLARCYATLELPEGWQCLHSDNNLGKIYKCQNCAKILKVHPSYFYILQLIDLGKQQIF